MKQPTIITNHHERQFVYGYELSEREKKEFDYIDDIVEFFLFPFG